MNGFPDLQATTKVLADKSRLKMLTLLMDGKFHTVSELARKIKIKSHTASYHLKILFESGWVSYYKQGRNIYYQLSSEEIANLLENLMYISPIKEIKSLNESSEYSKLKIGRSCYRHLAGNMGVFFFNFLIQSDYLILENYDLEITDKGIQYFEHIGIDIEKVKRQPGIFAKPCLDWTERTFHLGGNMGKAFFNLCEEKGYIVTNTENRSVSLTDIGEKFFCEFMEIKS